MAYECTILTYLQDRKTLSDRILALENLIDVMILSMAEHVSGVGATVSEYWLDDGQVKIKTGYRSVSELEAGIKGLERMKQLYKNQLRGRVITLVDVTKIR